MGKLESDLENKLDYVINKIIKRNETPGMAILVGNKKDILLEKCYGKRSINSKVNDVDKYTLYDLASLTKIIGTTMTILKLIEKGEITIFDRLSYFYDVESDKENIMIKDLLTHTSGLKSGIRLDKISNSYEDAIKFILKEPLEYESLSKVEYSDLGFILLGSIIEKVTNMKLDEAVNKFVLEPLEMNLTTFNPLSNSLFSSKELDNIAETEMIEKSNKFYKGIVHDENARFFGGVSGHAGLFSNLYDLNIFCKMLVNKGKSKGKRFINENLFNLMTNNITKNLNEGRGIGFSIFDMENSSAGKVISNGSFGHTGFTGTSIWVDKYKEVYVVILSNRINPSRDDLRFLRSRKLIHNVVFSSI